MSNKEVEIFIVEDDFIFTNILVEYLDILSKKYTKKNITIKYKTFYSTKETLYELKSKPDIVLLDYYILNDSHETETCESLLETIKSEAPFVDVIIISGKLTPIVSTKLIGLGAKTCIKKDTKNLLKLPGILSSIIENRFLFKNTVSKE